MSTGTYAKTATQLISDALRDASIVGADIPIEAADFARALNATNDILTHWQAQGIHLWSHTEALLPLNPNQASFDLGKSGTHCFTDYVYTTVKTAAAISATILDVVSTTGMTNGDFIGIELSTGNRHWTTLTIVDSDTVTLAVGLAASAAVGAEIYTYTTKIDEPIRVLDARYGYFNTDYEIPIRQQSRKEYYDQPNKTANGATSLWYYDRQLSVGRLLIWPLANSCKNLIRFTFIKPQYIPENQIENLLIPSEWYLPLKWAVAADLGLTYKIDPNMQQMIELKAATYLKSALDYDVENEAWSIQPDNR